MVSYIMKCTIDDIMHFITTFTVVLKLT